MTGTTNAARRRSELGDHAERPVVVEAATLTGHAGADDAPVEQTTPSDLAVDAAATGSAPAGGDGHADHQTSGAVALQGDTETFAFGTAMLPDLTAAQGSDDGDAHRLSNYVELVGYVRAQRVRGRAVIVRGHHDPDHNVGCYDILLHVDEADRATAFGITLQIRAHDRSLVELLQSLHDGDRLWVCGQLVSHETYDTRFAERAGPHGPTLGRPMQQLSVRVMRLRRARTEDANGSLVKLRGSLIQTPRITTHETETALVLARCIVNVESVLPAMNPRTRAVVHVQSRVPVDLPLLIPGAVQVLRRGNVIDVDGWIEPYRQRIRFDRDHEAAAVLARMQENFEARKQAMSAAELRRAEHAVRRQLVDLQSEPRLRIRAGYVMLIEGVPIGDLDEARANYVSWDRERRRINRERAARKATAPQHLYGTAQAPTAHAANSLAQPQRSDDAADGPEQHAGQSAGAATEQERARTGPAPLPLRRHRRQLKPDETTADLAEAPVGAEPGSAEGSVTDGD